MPPGRGRRRWRPAQTIEAMAMAMAALSDVGRVRRLPSINAAGAPGQTETLRGRFRVQPQGARSGLGGSSFFLRFDSSSRASSGQAASRSAHSFFASRSTRARMRAASSSLGLADAKLNRARQSGETLFRNAAIPESDLEIVGIAFGERSEDTQKTHHLVFRKTIERWLIVLHGEAVDRSAFRSEQPDVRATLLLASAPCVLRLECEVTNCSGHEHISLVHAALGRHRVCRSLFHHRLDCDPR